MSVPGWFSSITWSSPMRVEDLRSQRHVIPHLPGVYVFTNYDGPLERNTGVLYVGKAKSLCKRVPSYLVDPGTMRLFSMRSGSRRINTSLRHAGKAQLLVKLQQGARSDIWIRWCPTPDFSRLERELIIYLKPAFNTTGIGMQPDDDPSFA